MTPTYSHHFLGTKLQLDPQNKKLLIKGMFSKERIFDYTQIKTVSVERDAGLGVFSVLRFNVDDLASPTVKVFFFMQGTAEDWFARLEAAIGFKRIR